MKKLFCIMLSAFLLITFTLFGCFDDEEESHSPAHYHCIFKADGELKDYIALTGLSITDYDPDHYSERYALRIDQGYSIYNVFEIEIPDTVYEGVTYTKGDSFSIRYTSSDMTYGSQENFTVIIDKWEGAGGTVEGRFWGTLYYYDWRIDEFYYVEITEGAFGGLIYDSRDEEYDKIIESNI